MVNKSKPPQAIFSTIEPEFVGLQIEQAMETYRTQISLLIQIMIVLVIADVTVVGYSISTQISGILLIGSLFPIMILYAIYTIHRKMLPALYTAVSLEHRYGGSDVDWLASTFLSTTISTEYVATLKTISSIQDPIERIERLRGVPIVFLGSGKGVTRIALILVAIGQVIAPVILSLSFGWRLL